MNSKVNNRIQYQDIAKGICIILVILFHIGLPTNLHIFVGGFLLPVFYLSSGYWFKYDSNFKTFIFKKAKRLLTPYFCFGFILVMGFYIVSGFSLDALIFNVSELLVQKRYTTLWFLSTLFFGMIFFWMICKASKNNLKIIFIISFIISIAFIIYDVTFKIPLFWNIDTALIIQIYFAIGYISRIKEIDKRILTLSNGKKLGYFSLLTILYSVCIFLNSYLGFEMFQMYYCQYGCILLTLPASILGSAAIFIISTMINSKCINYIGRCSMTYFALHQTIFMEIMFIIYNSLGIDYKGNMVVICSIITFISVMILCTITDILIRNSKLKFMLG